MEETPVLAAYALRSSLDDCLVWCPSCCVWHQHATPEAQIHRGSHCHQHGNNSSKYSLSGYDLKLVGEIDLHTEKIIRAQKFKTHPSNLGLKIYGELHDKQ